MKGRVIHSLIIMLACGGTAQAQEKPRIITDAIKLPGSSVEFKLVELPGGKVTIRDGKGTEKEVEVKPFAIGQYEVMWDEYDVYWQALDLPTKEERDKAIHAKLRPSRIFSEEYLGRKEKGAPATSMFCREAKRYCEWLSKMTGHKYRLATEAEWEYACKAGGTGRFSKKELQEIAWFADNSENEHTHPCGKKQPNEFALYDMLGNVAEWVTREDGSECVAGGSFMDDAADVHSGVRENYTPSWDRTDPASRIKGESWMSDARHVGFRVVRDLESEKSRIKVKLPQGGFEMDMVRLADGKAGQTDGSIKGIWIGKYEVKYGQYNPFWQLLDLPEREASKKFDAKSRPSKPYRLQYFEGDDYPACGVSLLAAQKYCEWLSAQTGKKFRLPTEAEWEYACRAGEKEKKAREHTLDFYAWYEKNAEDAPHETGKLLPNAWGIYDMQGNVAEWVSAGKEHGVKGGSFADAESDLSPASRAPYTKLWQRDDPKDPKSQWWLSNGGFVGFRVVMEEGEARNPKLE